MPTKADLSKYHELMLPTLQAVERLGGSAKSRQISDAVVEALAPTEESDWSDRFEPESRPSNSRQRPARIDSHLASSNDD